MPGWSNLSKMHTNSAIDINKHASRIALAAIFAIGLALRLYCLDCHSLWFDEVASIEVAQRGLSAILWDRFGWMQVQTPLHYLIVWLSIQPVDPTTSATLVRLPSALAGSFSILVIYGLGREMFGRLQGLIAAMLMALSAISLNYSQDVRPYAMITLLTGLSVYCLLKADSTGKAAWWAAFAIATVINIANSYNILTLMLPALAPYLLWALWKVWQSGNHTTEERLRRLIAPTLSLVFIGIVSLLALSDLLQVPRTAPDLKQLHAVALLTSVPELAIWFTQFGTGGETEYTLQAIFLLVAVAGTYAALRSIKRSGVYLCWLFMIIPPVLLNILSTTNVVYQRYALFTMLFYFLLIGNGVATILSALRIAAKRLGFPAFAASRAIAVVTIIVFSLPFVYGVYGGNTGDSQSSLFTKPDQRGISTYLSERARPDDAVIFAGWDPTVSNFYWKSTPPAPVYSMRDPLLFKHHAKGSLYWVVSFDFGLPENMARNPRWTEVANFERIALYREVRPDVDLATSMEWFTESLGEARNSSRPLQQVADTLKGGVYEAHGQVAQAAEAYRSAGTYFPIGGEYLRTARGFMAHNEPDKAWRDALISKSMQPYEPQLHQFMADMLNRLGMADDAHVEAEIANILESIAISRK